MSICTTGYWVLSFPNFYQVYFLESASYFNRLRKLLLMTVRITTII